MGFSQWGARATKSACTHKSTKMALTQLNQSLVDDLTEAGMTYIGVHNLSPGEADAVCNSQYRERCLSVALCDDDHGCT